MSDRASMDLWQAMHDIRQEIASLCPDFVHFRLDGFFFQQRVVDFRLDFACFRLETRNAPWAIVYFQQGNGDLRPDFA